MPPMSFLGVVTKAGFMNKTATVTVSRWVIDKRTGKVCDDQTSNTQFLKYDDSSAFPGAKNSWCTMKEIVRVGYSLFYSYCSSRAPSLTFNFS